MYRRRKGRVLEGPLRFTVVVEAKLIDGCVADGPSVADVPLLKTFIGDGAETRHIGARRLELREWGNQMMIIKIVIKAEVLLVIQAVVKTYCELVATIGLHRRTHKFVAAISGSWDILEQVDGSGVH